MHKVYIFWEGYETLWNLHQLFVLCTASQIIDGDFAKFVAFSEYMNFMDDDENEDIIAHLQYVQLQREDLRRQELITENAE